MGSWLSGPAAAGLRPPGQEWRGQRLGLPPAGAGSVAGFGARVVAFAVDSVAANLLVGLTYLGGWRPAPGQRGWLVFAAFLLLELVMVAAVGQTVGMRMLRLRVARLDGGCPTLPWVAVRTVLLALAVPPLVIDRDNRGLHDRASATVVVRTG